MRGLGYRNRISLLVGCLWIAWGLSTNRCSLQRVAGRAGRPEIHVAHGSGLTVRAPVVARRLHAPAGSPVPISLGWTSRRSDSSSMASAMSKAWSANAFTSRWRRSDEPTTSPFMASAAK